MVQKPESPIKKSREWTSVGSSRTRARSRWCENNPSTPRVEQEEKEEARLNAGGRKAGENGEQPDTMEKSIGSPGFAPWKTRKHDCLSNGFRKCLGYGCCGRAFDPFLEGGRKQQMEGILSSRISEWH